MSGDNHWPPWSMSFGGKVAWCFPIRRDGRSWSTYVHWSKAGLETLEASRSVCVMGTWRRAWVDVLLEQFGPQLEAGLTLGEIAERDAGQAPIQPSVGDMRPRLQVLRGDQT